MAEGLVWLVCFIVGHVFGSIPCGLWLVKAAHGIDIREYGSKNIGTTNVFRTVGGKTAFFVLLCDMMKGLILPITQWEEWLLPVSELCSDIIILSF